MSRDKYGEALAALGITPGVAVDDDKEYVPSWSSRNKEMRALNKGVLLRTLGEEISGVDTELARRIFGQVRRPFDPREERDGFDTGSGAVQSYNAASDVDNGADGLRHASPVAKNMAEKVGEVIKSAVKLDKFEQKAYDSYINAGMSHEKSMEIAKLAGRMYFTQVEIPRKLVYGLGGKKVLIALGLDAWAEAKEEDIQNFIISAAKHPTEPTEPFVGP